MQYGEPRMVAELEAAHPELQALLHWLDEWSREQGMPDVLISSVYRTPESNAAVGGVAGSWHMFHCAADVDFVGRYTAKQLKALLGELKKRCTRPDWEFLVHDAGSGEHIHVARRDGNWRAAHSGGPRLTTPA